MTKRQATHMEGAKMNAKKRFKSYYLPRIFLILLAVIVAGGFWLAANTSANDAYEKCVEEWENALFLDKYSCLDRNEYPCLNDCETYNNRLKYEAPVLIARGQNMVDYSYMVHYSCVAVLDFSQFYGSAALLAIDNRYFNDEFISLLMSKDQKELAETLLQHKFKQLIENENWIPAWQMLEQAPWLKSVLTMTTNDLFSGLLSMNFGHSWGFNWTCTEAINLVEKYDLQSHPAFIQSTLPRCFDSQKGRNLPCMVLDLQFRYHFHGITLVNEFSQCFTQMFEDNIVTVDEARIYYENAQRFDFQPEQKKYFAWVYLLSLMKSASSETEMMTAINLMDDYGISQQELKDMLEIPERMNLLRLQYRMSILPRNVVEDCLPEKVEEYGNE